MLGYQKGGRDFLVDIGGDVLLRVPGGLASQVERLVGRAVFVRGILVCPSERSAQTEDTARGDQPTYSQGYQSNYLLFTLDVSTIDER